MSFNPGLHKSILIKILKDIYNDTTLGPILGFKGGTAASLFYNLDRASIDLDFDLLDSTKEDYMFKKIQHILETYGTVKEAQQKRFNLLYILVYANKTSGAPNIKVEINRRQFGSQYVVNSYLGIAMKVMTQPDMFAHKLCAMFERISKTNRDIYDVWYFLQHDWPVNTKIVENRTNTLFKNFLQQCVTALEEMSNENILSGMGELLNAKQKAWTKAKLRTETIFLLKLKLDSLN